MAGTKLNWIEALPVVLMSIRSTVNRSTGFTPFELHHRHMFPGPWGSKGEEPQKTPKITFAMLNQMSLVSLGHTAGAWRTKRGLNSRTRIRVGAFEGVIKEVATSFMDRTIPHDR